MPQRTRKAEGYITEVYPEYVLAMLRYLVDKRHAFFPHWIFRGLFSNRIPLSGLHVAAVRSIDEAACLSAELLGNFLAEGYVIEVGAEEVVIEVRYPNSAKREPRTVPHSAFAPGAVLWPGAPVQVHGEFREGGYTVRVYVPPEDEPLS